MTDRQLLRLEIVDFLRADRQEICADWARRCSEENVLQPLTAPETLAEGVSLYDQYVEAFASQDSSRLRSYFQELAVRLTPRGVQTAEIVGILLLLRQVIARGLRVHYESQPTKLNDAFDAYDIETDRVVVTVLAEFIGAREQTIREQQAAIRELSTPVLRVRDRLLILPMVGAIDPPRARQLTEQLLYGVRNHRAKVVVIDITGVPIMDTNVANHLILTVEAAKLLGATVIVSGVSADIANTMVRIGVNLRRLVTVGDLQGGIEEAERILGYEVTPIEEDEAPSPPPTGS